MVGHYQFSIPENLYLLFNFFEHTYPTDISISASYTVDGHRFQELYLNVTWSELLPVLIPTFSVIDGAMDIVVIAGKMAHMYVPDITDTGETNEV